MCSRDDSRGVYSEISRIVISVNFYHPCDTPFDPLIQHCVYFGGSLVYYECSIYFCGNVSIFENIPIGCIRCSNPSSVPGESSRSSWQMSYLHSLWISHKQPLSPSPSPSSDLFCLDTLLASGLYKHSLSIAGSVEMCRGGSLCMTFVRCPQVIWTR